MLAHPPQGGREVQAEAEVHSVEVVGILEEAAHLGREVAEVAGCIIMVARPQVEVAAERVG